jgi:hypothetical protein
MATIRNMVKSIQREVMTGELHPERASQLLLQATALLGNCAEEIRAAEHEYAVVLLKHLDGEEAANRAKIRAETSPEYLRKREARDTREVLVEMIRSIKYMLRAQEEEMRLAR